MRIISIDQGTTSTRALAVKPDGKLEIVHAIEHQQFYPQDGWVEHDPEELIRNVQTCVDAAGKIDAIGIDNQGESCLAWDAKTKTALSPVIVWQDNRTIEDIENLERDGFRNEVIKRTGLPLDPYFSACKLAWIVRNNSAAKRALSLGRLRLGTTDAFFLDRLTGHFVTDVSTASRTSLMNLERLEWDERLCQIFGVPIECLPEIVSTTGDFGAMDTDCGSVPITASVVDQQAALYGFGCRRKGEAKITFGTGAFALMVTGSEPAYKPELGLLPTVAWRKSGQDPVFALDGGVFTASAALNWAKSIGLFNNVADLNTFSATSAIDTGLAFVPALGGLGCPHWDAHARGTWLGLSLEHKSEQLVQSILEGVAFRSAEVIDAMDRCVSITQPLLVDGGMSNNSYFVQFLSNISGREICPTTMPELTGLGTMLLAADFLGCELGADPQYGHFMPKPGGRIIMDKYRQAVALSRKWSRM